MGSLDLDHDGRLTNAELKQGIANSGIKHLGSELEKVMLSLDTDGSGSIDYSEFLAAAIDKKVYLQDDVCWSAFHVFDRNGDGHISVQELQQVLASGDVETAMGSKAVQQLLKDIDTDGNGTIEFSEFMAMMRQ